MASMYKTTNLLKFIDVADMSEKMGNAEEHVHEAIADQEDHVAATSRDEGDGATKLPDVEIMTRPRKPPEAGYTKLNMVGPGLLKTGLMVMLLMLVYIKTELCPMGGRVNILRFEKSVVGKINYANQWIA